MVNVQTVLHQHISCMCKSVTPVNEVANQCSYSLIEVEGKDTEE